MVSGWLGFGLADLRPSAVGLEAAAHLHVGVGQVALVVLDQRRRRLVHVPASSGRRRDRRRVRAASTSSSTRGSGWPASPSGSATLPRAAGHAPRRRGSRAGTLPRGPPWACAARVCEFHPSPDLACSCCCASGEAIIVGAACRPSSVGPVTHRAARVASSGGCRRQLCVRAATHPSVPR